MTINTDSISNTLSELYGAARAKRETERWQASSQKFVSRFGREPEFAVSSPGRTEVCGNHCDHQKGCVIAAALSSDILAFAAPSDDGIAHVFSEGYKPMEIDLSDLKPRKEEKYTSAAMIRGVAAGLHEYWIGISGFYAYITSNVPAGSGISSSAAFEDLIANTFVALSKKSVGFDDIARACKLAENNYYGKASGLMDQMAVAKGGLCFMDFEQEEYPVVEKIDCDIAAFGLDICLVNTGGSHADKTKDYESIPAEMKRAASFFGKKVLREVSEKTFYERIGRLRSFAGDGAVLRAMHFFEECKRVRRCRTALEEGDRAAFLEIIRESGNSSWKYLQNIDDFSDRRGKCPAAMALALSEKILGAAGACRIHGGGFGGTIQAFVPAEMTSFYVSGMEQVFGKGCVSVVSVRNPGGCVIR